MSGNKDRARSKLLMMTGRQLEKVAGRHGVAFDDRGRGRVSKKQMAMQLAEVKSVVEELG